MTNDVFRVATLTVPCLFGLWTAVACRRAQYHGLPGSEALVWAGLSGVFFLLSLIRTARGLGLLRGFGDFLRGFFRQRGWYEDRRTLQIAASIAVAVLITALVAGKARTSRNARRHGLSVPITSDPVLAIEVEELARRLVGDLEDAEIAAPARAFAEAEVDVARGKRVRLERIRHLLALGADVENPMTQKDIAAVLGELAKLDRYDRRARGRRKLAARAFTDFFIEAAARQGLTALGSANIWECRPTDAQSQPGLGESSQIGRTDDGFARSQD